MTNKAHISCATSILLWCALSTLKAQDWGIVRHPENGIPFPSEELPTIEIECGDALEWMLAQENWYSNLEHPATFVFTDSNGSDTLTDVGIRLRGNTSRAAPKKSFKISFDTFEEGRAWHGLQKLNLNGEHNDPSIMRARLSWECLRDAGVPVSRSQHVRLFINGTDFGVYSNTEHIDGEWLEKRLDHAHGNLWKCTYPANLTFISNNPEAYKFTPSWSDQRVYELKTNEDNDDYAALAQFISVLNNTPIDELPCALERVFDVDAYLKVAAGEILMGHWDNYIGNQNNFYLYQRSTDNRLMYLPYDMDNTLGIQWFGEWTDQNPYAWTTESNRPLYSKLMDIPAYRNRFTWYLSWWMENWFTEPWINGRGETLTALLQDAVDEDAYYPLSYGFSPADFAEAVQIPWGYHVAHSISDYTASRIFWANLQLDELADASDPIVQCWAEGPLLNDTLEITCWIPEHFSPDAWNLMAQFGESALENTVTLNHDGSTVHGQQWSTRIGLNQQPSVQWMVEVTGPSGGVQHSPCTPELVWNTPSDLPIVINEVMPVNDDFHADQTGNFGDWVELYNAGNAAFNTNGLFLTNRLLEPARWPLPSVTLNPGQHLLLWCDDEVEVGALHTNFTLSGADDEVMLMQREQDEWRIVDLVEWENAPANASWGRTTDGAPTWMWFHTNAGNPPTPNSSNGTAASSLPNSGVVAPAMRLDSNPCSQPCHVELSHPGTWKLMGQNGQLVQSGMEQHAAFSGLTPGMYVLTWAGVHHQLSQTIILN